MVEWLTLHWQDLVEIVLAVLGVGSVIAKLTPTEADNKIIDKILNIIHLVGLTKK